MANPYPQAKPYGKPTGGTSSKNGVKPKGPRPPRFTGPAQNFRHSFPTTPSNDQVPGGIPNEFLVTPYTDQQIQTLAHGRADADTNAALAALPTEAQVRHPYEQASAATAGLTDALVQALQGTQHFQVGMAPAISGQYAQGATAAQAGADQAAAALGGQAQQLAGSTGGAATALAVPAVSAANATSGTIDAAHLRGTNQQLNIGDRLTQSLLGLQNQQTAVRERGVSAFDQYVNDLNQQNHQTQAANTTNSLNYAHLGIDQQNANNGTQQLANQIAIANAQNQRITNTTNATNQTRTNTANITANATNQRNQETHRHNLATEATSNYRATHPTAGTSRNTQGYTTSQVTTHLGSDIDRFRTLAMNAHKPAGAVKPHQTENVQYSYTGTDAYGNSRPATGVAHVTPQAYQQFLQSGAAGHRNWALLGVANRPNLTKTGVALVGTPGHGPRPAQGYYDTLTQVQSALETDNATYGYGLTPAQITQYSQRILHEAGWASPAPTVHTGRRPTHRGAN